MINRKGLKTVALVCTAVVLVTLAFVGWKIVKKLPKSAPDFTLNNLEGSPVTLSSYFADKGNVVILEVWASWCGNCQKTTPELAKLQSSYKDKAVKVVSVAIDDDIASVKTFAKANHLNYVICHDPSAKLMNKLYGVQAIPATFVIDRKGYIRFSHSGFVIIPESKDQMSGLKREINSLL